MKRSRVDAQASSKPIIISQALQHIYQTSSSSSSSSLSSNTSFSTSSTSTSSTSTSSTSTTSVVPPLDLVTTNEEIRLTLPNVKFVCGLQTLGSGTLYITTERVVWLQSLPTVSNLTSSSSNASPTTISLSSSSSSSSTSTSTAVHRTIGYSLVYPSISIHAICKDTLSFPEPCIFCQLDPSRNPSSSSASSGSNTTIDHHQHDYRRDIEIDTPEGVQAVTQNIELGRENNVVSSRANDDPLTANVTMTDTNISSSSVDSNSNIQAYEGHPDDVRFVPLNPGTELEVIFDTLSACAALHPDPMDDDDDGEGGNSNNLFSMMSMLAMMNRNTTNDDNSEDNYDDEGTLPGSGSNTRMEGVDEGIVFSTEQMEQLQHYDNLLVEEEGTEGETNDHPSNEE